MVYRKSVKRPNAFVTLCVCNANSRVGDNTTARTPYVMISFIILTKWKQYNDGHMAHE
jgi:hypothetical protein